MAAVKRVYESEKKYIDERRFTEGWHHHGHHHRNKIIVPFQSKETSFGRLSSLLVNWWRWRLSSIILQNEKKIWFKQLNAQFQYQDNTV